MEQAIKTLGHDVTELLPRGALRIGEWIVAELRRIPAVPAKPPRLGGMIEEEPVLVINLWEECEGFGAMDSEDRTTDEDILASTGFPMPMADN